MIHVSKILKKDIILWFYFISASLEKSLALWDTVNADSMKVKEVEVTANVAWSPKDQYPVLLAAGTAAQQLNASFDTTSSLDFYR